MVGLCPYKQWRLREEMDLTRPPTEPALMVIGIDKTDVDSWSELPSLPYWTNFVDDKTLVIFYPSPQGTVLFWDIEKRQSIAKDRLIVIRASELMAIDPFQGKMIYRIALESDLVDIVAGREWLVILKHNGLLLGDVNSGKPLRIFESETPRQCLNLAVSADLRKEAAQIAIPLSKVPTVEQ